MEVFLELANYGEIEEWTDLIPWFGKGHRISTSPIGAPGFF